jgi:hypothetical protein
MASAGSATRPVKLFGIPKIIFRSTKKSTPGQSKHPSSGRLGRCHAAGCRPRHQANARTCTGRGPARAVNLRGCGLSLRWLMVRFHVAPARNNADHRGPPRVPLRLPGAARFGLLHGHYVPRCGAAPRRRARRAPAARTGTVAAQRLKAVGRCSLLPRARRVGAPSAAASRAYPGRHLPGVQDRTGRRCGNVAGRGSRNDRHDRCALQSAAVARCAAGRGSRAGGSECPGST